MSAFPFILLFNQGIKGMPLGTIFEESGKMMAKIMLRPADDPRVDFIATL